MKLYIRYKRPNEEEGEAIFEGIDPQSINISYGFLSFSKDRTKSGWNFNLNHIKEMKVIE